MKKISSGIMLILFLAGSLSLLFGAHPVVAEPGTIYIRANGRIDPPTANITTSDNVTYTFRSNIVDSIVVERGYIVIDGAGYTLQGAGSGNGLYLGSGISSVTIKNTNIKNFNNGIWLHYSSDNTISRNNITNNVYCGIVLESSSSYDNVSGNRITNNQVGIWLDSSSSHNSISRNNITDNNQAGGNQAGIWLNSYNSYNTISGNSITNNPYGIKLMHSSNYNTISANSIAANSQYGIWIEYSYNNTVSGNSMTANSQYGIWFSYCSNDTVSGNNMTAEDWGGIVLEHSSNITISGNVFISTGLIVVYSSGNVAIDNTVNAEPLIYLEGESNQTVAEAGQVILVNCRYINVQNLNLSHTAIGLELWNTTHALISGNTITNNRIGMGLDSSSNHNTVSGNTFVGDGLIVDNSYENDVVDNLVNSKPLAYLESVSGSTVENAGQVILVNCQNITVENLNLSNTDRGVQLWGTSNSRIAGNTIASNWGGLFLSSSSGNTISGNNIAASVREPGIYLSSSSYNTISGNNIAHNNYDGINVDIISSFNTISENNISNNQHGIVFGHWFDSAVNNRLYHNNIINNTQQFSGDVRNTFDDGYPSGGNYWTNYTGMDVKSGPSQDQPGSDGMGDTPYTAAVNGIDHYPLLGPFKTFDAGKWNGKQYNVDIVSNSTLAGFTFNASGNPPTLSFNVTGANGTAGFCRVTIPKDLMWCDSPSQWIVTASSVLLSDCKIIPHLNYTYIYFAHTHSTKIVKIQSIHAVPEFQPFLLLPLLMILTLLAVVVRKRKRTH